MANASHTMDSTGTIERNESGAGAGFIVKKCEKTPTPASVAAANRNTVLQRNGITITTDIIIIITLITD